MAPTTKEAQRAELHKTIWRIANDLRGSVDGWDFKAYVLGMLFYRFISENLTAHINQGEHEAGDPNYDYIEESDHRVSGIREGVVEVAKAAYLCISLSPVNTPSDHASTLPSHSTTTVPSSISYMRVNYPL